MLSSSKEAILFQQLPFPWWMACGYIWMFVSKLCFLKVCLFLQYSTRSTSVLDNILLDILLYTSEMKSSFYTSKLDLRLHICDIKRHQQSWWLHLTCCLYWCSVCSDMQDAKGWCQSGGCVFWALGRLLALSYSYSISHFRSLAFSSIWFQSWIISIMTYNDKMEMSIKL